MNRTWYRALWFFEIIVVLVVVFVVTIPIRDYALREFKEWQRNPSPETMRAFQEKREEESQLRMVIAAPFAVAGILLAFPLVKFRFKSSKPS